MTKVINLGYREGCYLRIFRYEHGDLVYSMVQGDLTIYFLNFNEPPAEWWVWDEEYDKEFERDLRYEEWIQ